MGLFDLFSRKKNTIRCAKCGNPVSQEDIKGHDGKVYCTTCYRQVTAKPKTEYRPRTDREPERKTDPKPGKEPEKKADPKPARTTPKQPDYEGMPKVLADVREALDATDSKYTVSRFGDQWELESHVKGKASQFTLKYICKDQEKPALALRVFSLIQVEAHKVADICRVLNKMNREYRFLRFTLDEDNSVKVEYDFPVETTNAGPVALEMLLRTVNIIDDAYPAIMRELWS